MGRLHLDGDILLDIQRPTLAFPFHGMLSFSGKMSLTVRGSLVQICDCSNVKNLQSALEFNLNSNLYLYLNPNVWKRRQRFVFSFAYKFIPFKVYDAIRVL